MLKTKIVTKKKSKSALNASHIIKSFLACSVGCVGLFLWRKGEVGPFFALSDAFSVSGFFAWVFSVFPALLRLPEMDGASYMARCALSGLFPFATRGYSDHQKQRSIYRESTSKNCKNASKTREIGLVGGIFFVLGMLMSVIFL